jgi:PAS domain S-box-containing protein
VYAGILSACAVALVITWRLNPKEIGPRSWAIGSGWAALALVIFAMSAFRPELLWLNGSASPMAWLGLLYYSRGTRQYVGLPASPLWALVLYVLAVIAILLAGFFSQYNPASFIIVGSIVFAAYAFDIVRSVLSTREGRTAASYFIAFFFGLFGSTHIVRGVLTCFDLDRRGYARPVDSALVFVGILGGAATAMGFAMLISERLMRERAQTLARLEQSVDSLRERFVSLSGGDYQARAEFSGDGRPMDVVAKLFNETAEKIGSAFAELDGQRSLLLATQLSMVDGLVLVDRSGAIESVNPAFQGMLDRQDEELVGKHLPEILAEGSDQHVDAILGSAAHDPITELHMHFLSGTGATIPLTINAAPFADTEAKQEGFVLVVRDDRKLREAQAHLQMNDRLAAIGTVAAGVAHEVNNPLAYVISNLDYAVEELDDSQGALQPDIQGEMLSALQAARGGCERVRKIVQDLKSLSKRTDESTGVVDVNALLESAAAMLGNEVRHHAQIELSLSDVPGVSATEARLGQVFLNIIHNAAQAIDPGNADKEEIRVTSRLEEDFVIVEIRDTGCGIAPENLKRIFDTFYTTKAAGVGTGLGLSICRRVVGELGGRIEVESIVGEGTTFRIELPVDTGKPSAPEKTPLAAPVAATERRKILVIDDEAEVGNAARRILGRQHEVDTVTSAKDALGRVAEKNYDVILCDLMMPEMTGMQFYEQLQSDDPEHAKRVVFMSGGVFSPEAQRFLETVEQPKISKPFGTAVLREAVLPAKSNDA